MLILPASSKEKIIQITAVENSAYSDIAEVVIKEAYQRIGLEVNIIRLPAKAAIMRASKGKSDAELFRVNNINQQFTQLIKLPVPINVVEATIASLSNEINVQTWNDLSQYDFSIRQGIKYSENATAHLERHVVKHNEQLFKMLQAKRVDLIVLSRLTGLLAQQDPQYKTFIIPSHSIETYNLFHYMHQNNVHLVEPLTKALEQLQKEGFIKAARQDYINTIKNR